MSGRMLFIRKLNFVQGTRVAKRTITTRVKGFFVAENVPKISFVIGACALAVQVMLLYPKHELLSEQFADVEVGNVFCLLCVSITSFVVENCSSCLFNFKCP